MTSTAVVVADYQGYVHWLDKTTGELVARERIAKERGYAIRLWRSTTPWSC